MGANWSRNIPESGEGGEKGGCQGEVGDAVKSTFHQNRPANELNVVQYHSKREGLLTPNSVGRKRKRGS